MFPKIGVPKMDGLYMEPPIKMDDLGVPLFLETHIFNSEEAMFPWKKRRSDLEKEILLLFSEREVRNCHFFLGIFGLVNFFQGIFGLVKLVYIMKQDH